MIGGVLIIKKLHITLNYSDPKSKYCFAKADLIVLIEAEFAFIDSVVVALTEIAKLTKVSFQSSFLDFMENKAKGFSKLI